MPAEKFNAWSAASTSVLWTSDSEHLSHIMPYEDNKYADQFWSMSVTSRFTHQPLARPQCLSALTIRPTSRSKSVCVDINAWLTQTLLGMLDIAGDIDIRRRQTECDIYPNVAVNKHTFTFTESPGFILNLCHLSIWVEYSICGCEELIIWCEGKKMMWWAFLEEGWDSIGLAIKWRQ